VPARPHVEAALGCRICPAQEVYQGEAIREGPESMLHLARIGLISVVIGTVSSPPSSGPRAILNSARLR